MSEAKRTTDHEEIKKWVQARGGRPSHVKSTASKRDPGLLRIDFPGYTGGDSLEEISWEDFFESFDKHGLAFLYQDEKDSRFNKLVANTVDD